MARVAQATVCRCNFEPISGCELSGHRRFLVLSCDGLHKLSGVAIVAPTSAQDPRATHWSGIGPWPKPEVGLPCDKSRQCRS